MKKISLVTLSLLFAISFGYADIVSSLQDKKIESKSKGISFTVILNNNGSKKTEYIITERGNSKSFESKEYQNQAYLLHDNKFYQVPLMKDRETDVPVEIIIISDDENIKGKTVLNDDLIIPEYMNSTYAGKDTVNGYKCKILRKVASTEIKKDESGKQFTKQNIKKIYVTDKYGYPARIEKFTRITVQGSDDIKETPAGTIDFINFTTDLSERPILMPKETLVIDNTKKSSLDLGRQVK